MVSADGKLKQILKKGQEKSLKTDRITLVLGPRKEIEGVRMIFSMAAKGSNCTDIVRELNREGILLDGKQWNDVTVLNILTNPKYHGLQCLESTYSAPRHDSNRRRPSILDKEATCFSTDCG